MKIKSLIWSAVLGLTMLLALGAAAKNSGKESAKPAAASEESSAQDARVQGERRFRANCSRCHAAPPKFAPRVMATIVRHMRVRATITDEDMRLILRYMTE